MGTYENQVARIAAQPDWEVQSGITRYREAADGLVTGAKAIGKQPGLEGKAGDASAEQAHAVVKMVQTDGLGAGGENDALKQANASARQANAALQQLRDDYHSLPGVRLPAHVVDAITTATSPIAVAVSVLGGPVTVAGEAGLQVLNNMLIQNRERAAQDALKKFKDALSAASRGIGDGIRPDPPTPLQVKEPNPSDFPHVDASGAAATAGAFSVGGGSGSGSSGRVSAAGLGAGAAVGGIAAGAAGILGLNSGTGAVGYVSSGDQEAYPRGSVSDPGLGSIGQNGDREVQRPNSGSTGPGAGGPIRSGDDSLTGIGFNPGSGNPSTDYDMGLGGVLPGMALGGMAAGTVAVGASRLSGAAAAAGTVDATILGSAAGGAAGGAGGVGAGGMGRGLLGGLSADASKAGGAGTPEGLAGKVGMAGAKAGGAAEAAGARGGQPGMLGAPGGAGGDRQKGRRRGAGLGLIAPQIEEEAGPRIRSVGAMKGGRHHPGPAPRDLS
jgi:hypothetical protein